MSWLVQLLPYVEEGSAFKHIDFSVGAYDKKNAAVRAINIPLFVCPSYCGIRGNPSPGSRRRRQLDDQQLRRLLSRRRSAD